jgi:hypothetical protein
MMPLRVFVGVDERQPIAYTVAQHTLTQNSSVPVGVTPLIQKQLPVKRRGLTSFTYTRYLPPYLCDYKGYALFMDADVIVRGDIAQLPWFTPDLPAVSVVKHEWVSMGDAGNVNVMFERNAVMLFNCEKCTKLTPEWIEDPKNLPNKLSEWAGTDIGELPPGWNHLVGYNQPNPDAALAHFTMGIPCFDETCRDEFAVEWLEAHRQMNSTVTWKEIMGTSVHARWKR